MCVETDIAGVVASIPEGRVCSYGAVARLAGLPRRARLVARVLSTWTGEPLPWHRVLRSDGRIAFPTGSRPAREQARLLRGEGIEVRSGRVDLARHGWSGDLDAMLWGPR